MTTPQREDHPTPEAAESLASRLSRPRWGYIRPVGEGLVVPPEEHRTTGREESR